MLSNIPEELKERKQWVCWRAEPRGEKVTKIPYNPVTGELASVTDSSSWADFETAEEKALNGGGYSGVGFVLTKDDPYIFIDLDATNNKEAVALQQQFFTHLKSYSERSPSGKGLHIIARGNIPEAVRSSALKAEIYSHDRYMTMTGDVFEYGTIADAQDRALDVWKAVYSTTNKSKSGSSGQDFTDQPQRDEDQVVIDRMFRAKNGDYAQELFAGEWDQRFASQSDADQALMNIIAFYTQNKEQVIRIFRSSGLGKRKKAERDDYMNRTAATALAAIVRDLPDDVSDELKARQRAFLSEKKKKA